MTDINGKYSNSYYLQRLKGIVLTLCEHGLGHCGVRVCGSVSTLTDKSSKVVRSEQG